MIHGKLGDIKNYYHLLSEKAVQTIKDIMRLGGNIICEKTVLKKEEEKEFEFHKRHKDVFIILEGTILFYYSFHFVKNLKEYDFEKDIQFCIVENIGEIKATAGEFIIFDVGECHEPNIIYNHLPARSIIIKSEVFNE